MDADKDGKVSLPEWKKAIGDLFAVMKKKAKKAQPEESEKPVQGEDIIEKIIGKATNREEAEKNALEAFKKLDADSDGKVSTQEILGLTGKSDHADPKVKEAAQEIISLIDTNNDGVLD